MPNPNPTRRKIVVMAAAAAGAALVPPAARAAQGKRKSLPKAQTSGGKALLEALARRKSTRKFSSTAIMEQDIANILWAAWGENRPKMRTAPSARNRQNAVIYAVLEDGVWEYDAAAHELVLVMDGDQRGKFGGAPLTILYAAPPASDDEFAPMLVGSIYQNVGLYCASAGLGNVVKASGRDALKGKLVLPSGYQVQIVQSIGWPA